MRLLVACDRDFGFRVEEMQAAGLDRQADLIAGGDRRLGRDAGHGDTLSPDNVTLLCLPPYSAE